MLLPPGKKREIFLPPFEPPLETHSYYFLSMGESAFDADQNTFLFSLSVLKTNQQQQQQTTKRSTKVVSKNNTAKNAALLAATIATISTSGAALADDIEDVYAAAYAQNRSFGVVSPEHSAIDDANARKASSPMKKFVRPERAEAPKPAKKEGGGLPFSLPSIELPSVSLPSLPSLGGDAPADAPAAEE